MNSQKYDAVIIGAGMSGLAAGIRLAMYGQRVCIVERHSVLGGLNSFYQRKGRKFDVGLHALTNFARRGEKNRPLLKIFKQLRISRDAFELGEQYYSRILFPQAELRFGNDLEMLKAEVLQKFPQDFSDFLALIKVVEGHNELDLSAQSISARKLLKEIIKNPVLLDMLLCPLLIYGSAWENDMDFSQFVVMFKSIYLEGLSRPQGGVRRIIDVLEKRFLDEGGEIKFRHEVVSLGLSKGQSAKAVAEVRFKNGDSIATKKVFSSMGHPETLDMLGKERDLRGPRPGPGKMSFTETLLVYDSSPQDIGDKSTLIFYNNRPQYSYARCSGTFDRTSAVICCSDNYHGDHRNGSEGLIRVTNIANYGLWNELPRDIYRQEKEKVFENALELVPGMYPGFKGKLLFKDVFTPKTIYRYTHHREGAVYGSPDKVRDGRTSVKGLYLCGTDQGFLGIVGAILSGISMANLHGLMDVSPVRSGLSLASSDSVDQKTNKSAESVL